MAVTEIFDITRYTSAPLKMQAVIEYQGKTPAEVFAVMGDPEKIPDWYLLAKEVRMHPPEENGDVTFNVVFTFFGDVLEEVLHWNPPHRYVYLAKGDEFPIKDYVAEIEIVESQPGQGTMTWNIYCQDIEGKHFQKILPVILPPINEASIKRLTPLIGGTGYTVKSFF